MNEGRHEPARRMLAELVERQPSFLWAMQEMVQACIRARRFAEIEEELRERAKQRPEDPAPLYGLGYLGRRTGWPAKRVRSVLRRALKKDEECWPALMELAAVDVDEGKPERAEPKYRQVLAAFEAEKDRWGEATALNYLAHAARNRFDYVTALELYSIALRKKRGVGDRVGEAAALTSLGLLEFEIGNHRQSLQFHREALAIQERVGDDFGRLHSLVLLAVGHIRRENLDEAQEVLTRASHIARRSKYPKGLASVQINLAELAMRRRRFARAERLLGSVRNIATASGLEREGAAAERMLSRLWMMRGLFDDAERALARAKRLLKRSGDRLHRMSLASEEAQLALERNEPRRALRRARHAIQLNEQHRELGGGLCVTDLMAWLRLGLAQEALGRRGDALQSYRELMKGLERALPRTRREDLQLDLQALYQRPVERAATLILEDGSGAGVEPAAESLLLVDLGRAQALRLATDERLGEGRLPVALREKRSRLHAALRGVETALEQAMSGSGGPRSRQQALWRRHQALRSELEEADRQVEELLPREQSRAPDSLGVVQQVLGEDTALLYYLIGEDRVLVWVVTSTGVRAQQLGITPRGLDRMVRTFLSGLRAPESSINLGLALGAFSCELACRLYEILIAPFGDELADREQLVLIPDGVLHFLPFECLSSSCSGSGASHWSRLEYLVERRAVLVCPSLSHLTAVQSRKRRRSDSLVAMACSYGSVEGRSGSLGELEHVEEEVRGLARHFDKTRILLSKEATEVAYRRHASSATHFHFAGHAELDDGAPAYSGLVLSTGEPGEKGRLLHARDIREVSLRCELVTLSACSTGLGPLRRGEGVLSLARSFLVAGSDSVIMSLWRVQDRSTARFTDELYRSLTAAQSRIDALREAKLSLLRAGRDGIDDRLAHPWFWAPFVLIDTRIERTK
ncbi:MAG: CHAT domain-containing tetratricopeptide repeat protein [Acidobacteriota bacterium]